MSVGKVTVLAGSKPFTKALAGPIAERMGQPPFIAGDPGQAFALCRSASGVLVFEYAAAWMPVVKDLGRTSARLRMVAAVPPATADAEPALRELGVLAVPWQGDPATLLDALHGAAGPAPRAAPATTPTPFFGDVTAPLAPAAAVPAQPPVPPPLATPANRDAPAVWPATAPGDDEAEQLLCAAFAGLRAAGDPALDAVLAALTPVERQALEGDAAIADPAPLRRLAALRYRIASALASAPAPGAPVDAAAGGAMLAEIDGGLATLKALPEPVPGTAGQLDAFRKALVKEAVDLSELLHRLQPAAAPQAAPVVAARRIATGAVRIDGAAQAAEEERAGRRNVGLWVALALVVVAGGAFHAHAYWTRQGRADRNRVAGAPAGLFGTPAPGGVPQVLMPGRGPADPAEIQRFRREQEAKGNKIVELKGGGLLVIPPRLDGSPGPAAGSAAAAPVPAPAPATAPAPPPASAPAPASATGGKP
jgi:hypothetical protein